MDHFNYKNNELFAEDISVKEIAEKIETPFYLYSKATFERHFKVLDEALDFKNKLICFAMKSNGNLSILKTLIDLGSGIDVVSGGEILKALKAGCDPKKIVYSGVGKTKEDISYAIDKDIFQFNAESKEELEIINEIAAQKDKIADIAIRVNPNVSAGGHEKISTGKKGDKFGIDIDEAEEVIKFALTLDNLKFKGISTHIGSQITELEPFKLAFTKLLNFIKDLENQNIEISTIDFGGGVGAPYDETPVLAPEDYAEMVKKLVSDFGFEDKKLIFEPGRVISANAGILVTSVILVKNTKDKKFMIIDLGMNDLMRPALYDSKHKFIPVTAKNDSQKQQYDIVGPVCETSDIFAQSEFFQAVASGDLVAARSAGAYGAVMSNEYNARPLIPEILVDGSKFRLVRKRPNFSEMIALEDI